MRKAKIRGPRRRALICAAAAAWGHAGTVGRGNVRGCISASAVGDEDFMRSGGLQYRQQALEVRGFIEDGNNDGDAICGREFGLSGRQVWRFIHIRQRFQQCRFAVQQTRRSER